MGMSTSSPGPGASAPYDAPWLDQLGEGRTALVNDGADGGIANDREQPRFDGVAPPRRFGGARGELGAFARAGSRDASRPRQWSLFSIGRGRSPQGRCANEGVNAVGC
jgi:hypothetical protein